MFSVNVGTEHKTRLHWEYIWFKSVVLNWWVGTQKWVTGLFVPENMFLLFIFCNSKETLLESITITHQVVFK